VLFLQDFNLRCGRAHPSGAAEELAESRNPFVSIAYHAGLFAAEPVRIVVGISDPKTPVLFFALCSLIGVLASLAIVFVVVIFSLIDLPAVRERAENTTDPNYTPITWNVVNWNTTLVSGFSSIIFSFGGNAVVSFSAGSFWPRKGNRNF
jgi:hypothetical protein